MIVKTEQDKIVMSEVNDGVWLIITDRNSPSIDYKIKLNFGDEWDSFKQMINTPLVYQKEKT